MSLSHLLHYDSDDEDESRQAAAASNHTISAAASVPSITAAPTALHPTSHSTQPVASMKQLEKRALSDDEHEAEDDSSRKRKRTDTVTGASHSASVGGAVVNGSGRLTAASSSPARYIPPPASFFSFSAPTSSSAPAAPTDLLSLLPPPKNTRSNNAAPRQPPLPSRTADIIAVSAASTLVASSPPPRPPSPPPAAAATTASPPTSAISPLPAESIVAPPPGIRREVDPNSRFESTSYPALPSASRIAYSTASPYAVHQSPYLSASTTTAQAPAAVTSSEEPRMQRQFVDAAHIVDVRVDDLTQPPSAADIAAAQQLQAAGAVGDIRLKTTYWDARQGKEVSVVGVAGKQQRTHQINSLAIQAKKVELEIMRLKEHSAQNRRDKRSKYGW